MDRAPSVYTHAGVPLPEYGGSQEGSPDVEMRRMIFLWAAIHGAISALI